MSRRVNEHSIALAREWRRLGRAATFVAILTSPALFIVLYQRFEWPLAWALLGTLIGIAAFRGLVDVLAHKLIPAPSLYGAERELVPEGVKLDYIGREYRASPGEGYPAAHNAEQNRIVTEALTTE